MKKIYNTRKIQIAVLCQFMVEQHNAHYCGTGFLTFGGEHIPFKKAVKMYNESLDGSKELEQLKLTYNKKDKKIVCLNHSIKPTNYIISNIGEEGFLKVLKISQ
ncbi:hypothetical protein Meda_009 [Salmonella phage Meda]|uniref:DUF7390 domain-containing protein n=3 Tax=Felixounavirus TaxID=1198140 RepID=A0A385IRV6_9CAUD|nr:putative HNH endonuclease [Enterobacteria phage vB_EcoM_IME338]AXY86269.1 hypothetical protein Meda_009 [Salmonella phage Meda]UGL60396.1 putative HNH endonuclease [Salmonella phage vB_SenM-pSJ21]